ncbi:MAG: hypothetical protein AAF202_08120, partial [Pseudomonadota bacterium]
SFHSNLVFVLGNFDMSANVPKGAWCDVWDGLYWMFIDRNQKFFSSNPRLSMMVRTLAKMKADRKQTIFSAADDFLQKTTEI